MIYNGHTQKKYLKRYVAQNKMRGFSLILSEEKCFIANKGNVPKAKDTHKRIVLQNTKLLYT